jgi:hypothetical protein
VLANQIYPQQFDFKLVIVLSHGCDDSMIIRRAITSYILLGCIVVELNVLLTKEFGLKPFDVNWMK